MNDETKKKITQRYERELNKGERFWPDSIFKDVIMALAIFLVLVLLATFLGVPSDPKADPSDATYVPRPEWYFLFLFKFLALYGQVPLIGKIEWLATVIIPSIAVGLLIFLPFFDKGPERYYGKRIFPISIIGIVVVSMVTLTLMADVPTGPTLVGFLQTIGGLVVPGLAYFVLVLMSFVFKKTPAKVMIWTAIVTAALMIGFTGTVLAMYKAPAAEEVTIAYTIDDQIQAGQDLYAVNCVECHGEDGKVTKIEGVKGLENKVIPPINGKDVLYTLNDASLAEVMVYGRPDAGMNPFGKAYNPAGLSKSEIDYIVTFMRYQWDDRFEKVQLKPLYPPLAVGEVPSYDVHIAPIVKRYCLSCHRAGKDNLNYWMDTYDNVLKTGDEAPNVTSGDEKSPLLVVIGGTPIPDPDNPGKDLVRTMPPNKALKEDVINVFRRWIMNGMPQTADEASKLTAVPLPGKAIDLTGDPVKGAAIFTAQCVQCHGIDGKQGVDNPGSTDGTVPPLNPIDEAIKNADPKAFATNLDLYVENGSTPEGTSPKLKMPAFGAQSFLTQQQIADVIAYVMGLNK
jgi:mono/diheme cytochrome c family protein